MIASGPTVALEVSFEIKAQNVECSINKKVGASYDRSALVTVRKLASTEGVHSIGSANNTDEFVKGPRIRKRAFVNVVFIYSNDVPIINVLSWRTLLENDA